MQQEITVRKESLEELHANFMNANPFPHVYIDDFLETGLANSLSENFPPLSEMDILYHGLNENKGEHSNFQNLHEDFRRLQHLLS